MRYVRHVESFAERSETTFRRAGSQFIAAKVLAALPTTDRTMHAGAVGHLQAVDMEQSLHYYRSLVWEPTKRAQKNAFRFLVPTFGSAACNEDYSYFC